MKKLLLTMALAAFASTGFAADKVRFGTEGAYAPWNFMDDSGKLAGFEIELGEELCRRAKLECEFVVNEWDSIIPNLIAGNYDGIMAGMSVTDERKKTITFSEEYYPADPSLFAAAKGDKFDFANLKGVKIGAQGATVQAAYLEANLKEGNTIKLYEKPDQSVADLAAGNIDLLLADGSFLDPVVEGSGGMLVYTGPKVQIGGGVAVGMRQKDSELAVKINAAIAEVKADGTLDKMIQEFFKKGPFYKTETVRFGTEGAYAPWNFMDDSGKLAGFEIELGAELCKRASLTCEFVVNEWDSIIPNLIAGNYDGIMAGMSVTDERKKTINFSEEYYPADPSLFAAAKGDKFDFDNLKGVKIGAQGATVQAAYLEANLKEGNTIKLYEKPDQSVADLAAGNIDLLLADGSFLDPVVEGSGGMLVYMGPKVQIGGGVAVGMRQKDSDLADKMNAAIAEVKKDGTLDKMIKDFFKKGPFYAAE